MSESLDKTARRIIGVLIEKQLATPNLYPLSQNALTNGCNQKSNRCPVLLLQEFEVEGALRNLYVHEWVTNVTGPGSRVLKWKHRAQDKLNLSDSELPIMAELMLRGAQTAGELRSHVARMKTFGSLDEILVEVEELRRRGLVRLLPPTPGRRAQFYDHTLYLESESEDSDEEVDKDISATAPRVTSDRIGDFEQRITLLEEKIHRLEQALGMPSQDDDDQE